MYGRTATITESDAMLYLALGTLTAAARSALADSLIDVSFALVLAELGDADQTVVLARALHAGMRCFCA